jgi:hypothetical protein
VSVNAAPVTTVPLGLVSVMVRTLVAPLPIDDGVKPLETASVLETISVSEAAAVLEPALAVVSAPTASVLV